MNKFWKLSEELYRSLHRWPTMVAFFALGCLLGWIITYIWPSYYRATTQIYVGLNPYRTFEDAEFLALTKPIYQNLDNYLLWQMSQLETVILLDEFIQESLSLLRQKDPYWENVSDAQLRAMLDTSWRSAGTWSLNANTQSLNYAIQATETWGQVVLKRVQEAVISARNNYLVDQEIQAVTQEQLEASLRKQELSSTKYTIHKWLEEADKLPENQPLLPYERWRILSIASRLAQYTPAWENFLDNQPHPDSTTQVYIDWVNQLFSIIDNEIYVLDQRSASLDERRSVLAEQYSDEADNSLGLSPNLEIEGIEQLSPIAVRPTGTLTLIGGFTGLLTWVLTQLIIITRREQSL